MKKRLELLSEEQWGILEPLFPERKRRKDGRGRPWAANRECLEGILWVSAYGSTMARHARAVSGWLDLLASIA